MKRDNYTCQECGAQVGMNGQIAHKIRKGKLTENFISKYLIINHGVYLKIRVIKNDIIDHPLNVVYTCGLSCNGKQNIFYKPVLRDGLLEKILREVL